MAVKTFHGATRWRRFRTWQKSLPKDVTVTGIGCWPNEEDVPELFIEYGGSKQATAQEQRQEWHELLHTKHQSRR
jgi:hypothetical protein